MALMLTLFVISAVSANEQGKQAASAEKDTVMSHAITIADLPKNDTNYAPVLKPPVSEKIRCGYVTLEPGKAGEVHSTEVWEEMIVVLEGSAVMHSGDIDQKFTVGQVAYVPPHTTHFMKNDGNSILKYLYIVAKTEE